MLPKHLHTSLTLLTLALALIGGLSRFVAIAVADDDATAAAPLAADADRVRPDAARALSALSESLFAAHCTHCHGADFAERDVRLDRLDPMRAKGDDRQTWLAVVDQLALGTMPPEGEPRPTLDEVQRAIATIRSALDVPSSTPLATDLPGLGNYVDHRLLFTEPPVRRAASDPRLWRISPYIFREAVNVVSGKPLLVVKKNQGGNGLHPALPSVTPTHSFRDASLPHGFEDATTELLLDMAWQVGGLELAARHAPQELRLAVQRHDASARALEAAIRYQFGLVLQRDPTDVELAGLVELGRATAAEADASVALQTVLAAVLVLPEAVFRYELGSGPADEHGRVRLAPRETAFAVAYALADSPPDDERRAAAERGELGSAAGVQRQVQRLLDRGPQANPRLLRFFQEYFEYTRVAEIFKDARVRKHYNPEQLIDDADLVVLGALEEDRQVLRRLLTTSEYYVNASLTGAIGTNRPDQRQKWYYELFNLPREWDWQSTQPIHFSPHERSGILTHPAWLLSFSDNEKNQAIQRGYWVRHKLLGGTVPDVPIGVDAQLPTDPTLTLREKMQVTREEYCWRCHQRMDPLGLPFEQYDDFGIYRTRELERPVDTTGLIECGVPEIDGAVSNPIEYLHRLAHSEHVEQVFVRHAFRYWLGRNETLDDAPTLIDAHRAYRDHDGSLEAMLVSLLSSDSFLYRRLPAHADQTEQH